MSIYTATVQLRVVADTPADAHTEVADALYKIIQLPEYAVVAWEYLKVGDQSLFPTESDSGPRCPRSQEHDHPLVRALQETTINVKNSV